MTDQKRKKVSLLGSTGSIGVSTLDICRKHIEHFEVVALAAGNNSKVLLKQIEEFRPKLVSVQSQEAYQSLVSQIPQGVELVCGAQGAKQAACIQEADVVVSAIVGAAGLEPTLEALKNKKPVALANKESMVIAGELMSKVASDHGVPIVPVDSEHSAIFQCLNGEHVEDIENLVLTASGGPFWEKPVQEFQSITKEQALKHPNWDMGAKITIDSATMMNKGLEVMEAHWLFNMPVEKIQVVIHPQSIVHSMVEFVDGSVMAQMGEPDMRVPIAYALSYPRRITTGVKRLHLPEHQNLVFDQPDLQKFRCLKLAFDVARAGGSLAPVLNAANEVVVENFLQDKIAFVDIPALVDKCLQKHNSYPLTDLDSVLEADRWAREYVMGLIT